MLSSGCRFDDDEEEELWTTVRLAALPGYPSRPHRRRRTGPAFTCRAMACASACRSATARTPGFLASRYSRSATAKRPLSEMPSSAAYRRPRCANSSGSRNVMAIGESLSVWYHNDITASRNASAKPRARYARSCCANRWCFRLPSATVKKPGWRGLERHLPSAEGQTRSELPHPHHPASMKNLAACDRRLDHKLTPVGVPPQQSQS
jgi:hypothetical protein